MPALSKGRHMQVTQAITSQMNRVLHFLPNKLRIADVVDAYVAPEHKELLTEASKLTKVFNISHITHRAAVNGMNMQLVLSLTGTKQEVIPLLPKYVSDGPRNAEGEGWQAIEALVREQLRVRTEFTVMKAIVDHLHEKCMNPQGVRFYFPTLVSLIAMDDSAEGKKLADRLRALHAPQTPLYLSPEFRQAVKDAAKAFTLAELLPPVPAESKVKSVTVHFTPASKIRTPWGDDVPLL